MGVISRLLLGMCFPLCLLLVTTHGRVGCGAVSGGHALRRCCFSLDCVGAISCRTSKTKTPSDTVTAGTNWAGLQESGQDLLHRWGGICHHQPLVAALRGGRLVEDDAVELLLEPVLRCHGVEHRASRSGADHQHGRIVMDQTKHSQARSPGQRNAPSTRQPNHLPQRTHHLMASSLVTLCLTPTWAFCFRRRATR